MKNHLFLLYCIIICCINYFFKMYEQLSESRVIKQVDISDVDGQIEQKIEQKYYENLQTLRQEYEEDLKRNKEDIRKIYEEKVIFF